MRLIFLALVVGLPQWSFAETPCTLSKADTAWLARADEAWRWTANQSLQVSNRDSPVSRVFFDETCVYRGTRKIGRRGAAHSGIIVRPDGKTLTPQVTSFTAPDEKHRGSFMVMALPAIWRAAGVQSDLTLETLMVAVYIHEMTHTRQFATINPLIDAVDKRWPLGDDVNDDIVQTRFKDTPEYVAQFDVERTLLYRAVEAPTPEATRSLAREALSFIDARRARYFTQGNEQLLELEDVFLTLEGVAQWAAYRWIIDRKGANADVGMALPQIRRGGRQWSQDEGLAIYLIVDRLVPNWQKRTFADRPATALQLLAEAVR
jgi:hypothetical protein